MKKIIFVLLSAIAFLQASAQKLPTTQKGSVKAPVNFKIDGKADEWGNKFQAYNKSTDFYYTIANTNDELYLIIQTKEIHVFNKIVDRGLTLSVKNPETGKAANFTFPTPVNNVINRRLSTSLRGDMLLTSGKVAEADMIANNKKLRDSHKFIKAEGVEGVDTVLSVYNENGIRAAELFDNNRAYTLEMVIKLKLIGFSSGNVNKISYKLKVNPIDGFFKPDGREVFEEGMQPTPEEMVKLRAEVHLKAAKMFGGTDFEGEYTLAE